MHKQQWRGLALGLASFGALVVILAMVVSNSTWLITIGTVPILLAIGVFPV